VTKDQFAIDVKDLSTGLPLNGTILRLWDIAQKFITVSVHTDSHDMSRFQKKRRLYG